MAHKIHPGLVAELVVVQHRHRHAVHHEIFHFLARVASQILEQLPELRFRPLAPLPPRFRHFQQLREALLQHVRHRNAHFCRSLCEVLGEAAEERHEVVDYAEKLLGVAVNKLKKLLGHEQVFSLDLFPGLRQDRQYQLAEVAVRLHRDLQQDALEDWH